MKTLCLLIFLIVISFNLISQSDSIKRVKVPITVSNDVGNLTIGEVGLDSLASDDFDYVYGEVNLPTLSPVAAWDARLLLPEGGFSGVKSSFKDCGSLSSPQASFVKLSVYNQLEEKVDEIINENLSAGIYNYTWNASKLVSSIYF